MIGTHGYRLLAEAVLILHLGVVAFIVGGLVLIVAGNLRGWRWVNGLGFRVAHLTAIGVVVAEAWFGAVCPLTTLEMWLRAEGASPTYSGSFVEHWLQSLLYVAAPPWAFVLAYSLFGLVVAATWWYFPPERRASHR